MRAGAGAVALFVALIALFLVPAAATAEFGVAAFSATARERDGTIDRRAASHPFALEVDLAMNTEQGQPDGLLSRMQIDLPPGLIGNPLAVPRCSIADFEGEGALCPGSSQIGVLRGTLAGLSQAKAPLYNLAPSPGYAAAFGVSVNGNTVVERLRLIGDGGQSFIRLDATLPPSLGIIDVEQEIWGVPADRDHDADRFCVAPDGSTIEGCSSEAEPQPLLTMPSSCVRPFRTELTATSLGPPALSVVATALSGDAGGNPRPLVGCDVVPFEPILGLSTEGAALAPTGLLAGFEVPRHEAASTIASASVSGLQLDLPPGLALNPSAAAWLAGCAPAEVGLMSAPGVQTARFDAGPASCPPGSGFGSVTVRTPLIDHPLSGQIYLARPGDNPFQATFAIYLVVDDPATGTVLKLPGLIEPNPADGRLGVTLTDLPPFPFAGFEVRFDGGPRAPLVSPDSCGTHFATALIAPSSAPFAPSVVRRPGFELGAVAGRPCPRPEADRPAAPSFSAGTSLPVAGSRAPLTIRLSREDADQHFGSFEVTLPPGLTAGIASTASCPEAAIAAAAAATGLAERQKPSCPDSSSLGSVDLEAGIGPRPVRLAGAVYLAGPYRGAPYSLAIVVPAQAGPFDLGTVVVRAALRLDPRTLQLTTRSDRLPQILAGVPLQLRSLALELDRPGLVRNPTSCEAMTIEGATTSASGVTAPLRARFQVGGCKALSLKPRLRLRLGGALGRNGHPSLAADLVPRAGDANLAAVGFTLPAGELLDVRHVAALCDRSSAPESCPPASRLGRLRLFSPLLEDPLEGPIYLRTPSHRLPDLTADLRSGRIRVVLRGRASAPRGRLRIAFPALPDVPLSRASLWLPGGRRGIVVNSASLCHGPHRAAVTLAAHNGRRLLLHPRIVPPGSCS